MFQWCLAGQAVDPDEMSGISGGSQLCFTETKGCVIAGGYQQVRHSAATGFFKGSLIKVNIEP